MYEIELRRAAEAAPRSELPAVTALLWQAFAAGHLSEAEAEALSALIETRRAVPAEPRPAPARRGARPRTPESLQRRRRWAASGRLPPALATRFTPAEQAVLAVVAAEAARHGRCALAHGHLAAISGTSESTVKRALRAARDLGLITVEERRLTATRNLPNLVRVVSPEWLAWSRLTRRGVGVRDEPARLRFIPERQAKRVSGASKGLPRPAGRPRRSVSSGSGAGN